MKKVYLIVVLLISIAISSYETVFSQSVSYSSDSVIAQKCDNQFSVTGIIKVYNNTNNQVTLNWIMTQSVFPATGWNALIIDPVQFPPNFPGGAAQVDANDSADILFHIVPDSMSPGDTAIFQILIYDPMDSIGTATYLTAMIYCPLTSGIFENGYSNSISIFPNPFKERAMIRWKATDGRCSLMIYNSNGQLVRRIEESENENAMLEKNNLKSGLYLWELWNNKYNAGGGKLIIE